MIIDKANDLHPEKDNLGYERTETTKVSLHSLARVLFTAHTISKSLRILKVKS